MPQDLRAGTKVGAYEVKGLIGRGGMGEVYRAHDCKLHREVALKLLPETFASDPERVARFEREARTLAALNHPHIAQIYGFEHANETQALVMELVEGEDLGQLIARGPVPLDEALPIARQLADALEAAHEAGIVHRDLKPANIRVRPDGTVKVLDFGLAKALEPQSRGASHANSPTFTSPALMTHAGVILGTASYMSPEQARGKAVDKRADIWAFGAVLFELLTGAVAFSGDSVADVLASIVTRDPDWALLPGDVPPAIHRLLHRCLQKDHRQRLRDIGEARVALSASQLDGESQAALPSRPEHRRRREFVAWVVAGLSLLVAGIAMWNRPAARAPDVTPRLVVFNIPLPPGARLSPQSSPALSPDGQQLVFSANSDGLVRLWIHALDSRVPAPIRGTEGGQNPFWAPTGRAIGFFADGKLKTVALDGSPPRVLCDAPDGRGGSWGRDGDVLFALAAGPLYRVAAAGGSPQPVRIADGARDESARRYPHFLPDGRHFLYLIWRGPEKARGVYAASLDSDAATHLVAADAAAVYAAPGYLLFAREGTLLAQRFDVDRLTLTGEATPVATSIRRDTSQQSAYSAAADALVTIGGGTASVRRLVWLNRAGKMLGRFSQEGSFAALDLSPEGRRAIVEIADLPEPGDIWLVDLQRDTMSRITSAAGADYNPIWGPDGEHVVFSSNRDGPSDLFQTSVSRTGQDEPILTSSTMKFAFDWSPDARYIVYGTGLTSGQGDLWMTSTADRKAVPLLTSPFLETHAQVSPNGRWFAYVSNESGSNDVYVDTFPIPSQKHRISRRGGTHPRWRGDSNELFFLDPDRQLTSVALRHGGVLEAETPRPLFAMPPMAGSPIRYSYDVTSDGQRILAVAVVNEGIPSGLTVTLGWSARLPPQAAAATER